jgi:hypothetical protein
VIHLALRKEPGAASHIAEELQETTFARRLLGRPDVNVGPNTAYSGKRVVNDPGDRRMRRRSFDPASSVVTPVVQMGIRLLATLLQARS